MKNCHYENSAAGWEPQNVVQVIGEETGHPQGIIPII